MHKKRRRQIAKLKGEPHFKPKECWCLFYKLARVNAAGIRTFLNMKRRRVPTWYLPDDQKENPSGEAIAKASEEWETDLRKMLYSFEEIASCKRHSPRAQWFEEECMKLEKHGIEPWQLSENGKWLLAVPNAPEEIMDRESKYNQKIIEGLVTFAYHFDSLWE